MNNNFNFKINKHPKILIKLLMSKKNMFINTRTSYFKNNQIRTKLLLFIDNEIQSKVKQNIYKLKFNFEDETRISFEETYSQKQINKYGFSSSNILETKINVNSDKSISTIEDSSNKVKKQLYRKGRDNSHCTSINKEGNFPNKLLNNTIHFHRKYYSIKNLSRQSSTFLILPKQKNAVEYLKSLCENLKICKHDKKPVKHTKSTTIKSKLFNFSKDKKDRKKSNKIKLPKSNNNVYSYSLFRKSQKENFVSNSKHRISGKSANSVFVKFIHNE